MGKFCIGKFPIGESGATSKTGLALGFCGDSFSASPWGGVYCKLCSKRSVTFYHRRVGSGRGRQIFLFTFVVPIPELFTQVATPGLRSSVALELGLATFGKKDNIPKSYVTATVFESTCRRVIKMPFCKAHKSGDISDYYSACFLKNTKNRKTIFHEGLPCF